MAPGRCTPQGPHLSACSPLSLELCFTPRPKSLLVPLGAAQCLGPGLWVSGEVGRAGGLSHKSRRFAGGCRPGTFSDGRTLCSEKFLELFIPPRHPPIFSNSWRHALPLLTRQARCPASAPVLAMPWNIHVRLGAHLHTPPPPPPRALLHPQEHTCTPSPGGATGGEAAGCLSMHGVRGRGGVHAGVSWACTRVAGHARGGPAHAQEVVRQAWGGVCVWGGGLGMHRGVARAWPGGAGCSLCRR